MDRLKLVLALCLTVSLDASPLTDCIDKLVEKDGEKDITVVSACVEFTYHKMWQLPYGKECFDETMNGWAKEMYNYYLPYNNTKSMKKKLKEILHRASQMQCVCEDKSCR
jgi:hypothetical protein